MIIFPLKKIILTLVTLIATGCATMDNPKKKIKPKDVPRLKPLLFSAIGGDVKKSMSFMNTLDKSKISALERSIVEKYKERFSSEYPRNRSESYVNRIIDTFRRYWHKGLLSEFEQEEGFQWVFGELSPLAKERGFEVSKFSEDEFERMAKFLMNELKKDGFYSIIGRVKPFLNIMVWKNEYEKDYSVELGGSAPQNVKVLFMDDFLELGWGAYATFDILYVGGWAKKDKLFCVKPAYDLKSENFAVSYLGHEARHFADYKLFPKLDQLDLEYRAKLTEILLSESTYEDVLDKFFHEQKKDIKNPHAFSAHLIMTKLSERLGVDNDLPSLHSASKVAVKSTVKAMLAEHSDLVTKNGAESTESVF